MINAEDLTHRYGRHVVFTQLSLSVQSGDTVAISGRNGSGKSTLVKILAGLLRPTRGTVHLQTAVSDSGSKVGLVAPYSDLYKDLTLRENLEFIGRLSRRRLTLTDFSRIVTTVGLEGAEDQVLRTFSTGMLQRARFAAAVLHTPRALLLDEPTIGLDRDGYALFKRVVDDTRRAGCAIIVASNAQRDIEVADRCICIEDYAPNAKDRT